jgi:hypothetical protein
MHLTGPELLSIQTNVLQAFEKLAVHKVPVQFGSLRLSTDTDEINSDWVSQWKPIRDAAEKSVVRKMWDWASIEKNPERKKTKVGWYQRDDLLALAHIEICTAQDNWRFKQPSVAIYLFERAQNAATLKGLVRPIFYETARQIGISKDIPNMSVIGGYEATDQYDFDLMFGMESDSPNVLPMKDSHYRTRPCNVAFDWDLLPEYFENLRAKNAAVLPTPAF